MKKQRIFLQIFIAVICAAPVFGQIRRDPNLAVVDNPSLPKLVSSQPGAYDFSGVHMCFDQFPSVKIPSKPDYNPPAPPPRLKSNGDIEYPSSVRQPLTSISPVLLWNPGDVITVGFYKDQTTDFVINKVKQFAKEWEAIANIKFLFIDNVNAATVRCGFVRGGGNWSWLGRMTTGNIFQQPTMNFGFFDNNTPDIEFRRSVLHEFGHTLGFVHEHQAPTAGIPWDKEKVYAYFAAPPNNWSRQQVDLNIFLKYSNLVTNSSRYDKSSIMHYYFPSYLTTDGSSFPQNNNFSPTDIQFAGYVYPFPPKPTTSSGTIHTGDDCDAIDFKLEFFPGLDSNIIEFVLQPGIDPWNEKVTWWKQIGIPMKGGVENPIQLRIDGRSELVRLPVNIIDFTRPISFSKAKLLGIHTLLAYKWNPFPAMKGGCRLTLTWKQDRCQKTL